MCIERNMISCKRWCDNLKNNQDLLGIVPSLEKLFNNFCFIIGMVFNVASTNGDAHRSNRNDPQLPLDGANIEWVTTFKLLGVHFLKLLVQSGASLHYITTQHYSGVHDSGVRLPILALKPHWDSVGCPGVYSEAGHAPHESGELQDSLYNCRHWRFQFQVWTINNKFVNRSVTNTESSHHYLLPENVISDITNKLLVYRCLSGTAPQYLVGKLQRVVVLTFLNFIVYFEVH